MGWIKEKVEIQSRQNGSPVDRYKTTLGELKFSLGLEEAALTFKTDP